MLTKADVVSASYRTEFYFRSRKDGAVKRCRVNGSCKTWKTRPDEFSLPMKFGLKECFYITHENAHAFYLTEAEANASDKAIRVFA